ncbi:mitochondrial RNA pseudouridine synthase rpusd4-like [Solea senegalensis]|uniref:Pseudouridylate synthase RPUSD4, mitochondrial n=2 Tax=Solea senegalensis TaxID=28829 RepID=A0AAV6QL90_SOLSE|nr:mitochondrial RNA pseudouridine synthase rpusd4-like [Solea senegalensis]KAG7493435.1 mitochondrial RNA pseudouridine synthase rpusd4-like [Solea senegalensis]
MFPAVCVVLLKPKSNTYSRCTIMNNCRRIARNCRCSSGLNSLMSRFKTRTNGHSCPGAAPSHNRGQATVTGGKPRLTAADLAQQVQQEKTKTPATETPMSKQQKRVMELKKFTLQLQNVHPNVLAKHLFRGVLYQDKHFVVINKPHGVPVQDASRGTSISSVLPTLSKMMDGMKTKSDSQLFPSLGLEKETTGVLLLARSDEAVGYILNMHRENNVQRKYWVITVGVPVPSEGVIDIPIIEREITGPQPHYKMGLSPLFRMNDSGDGVTKVRGHRQAHPAVTKYRVLDSSTGCSLVELQPLTGVKHQMRVHMALALACPILGDHKYSHWSKLAPQRLPERVLGKLGLEQSKSRYIPLHLHARQLTLSRASKGDIDVSCPLPKYFTQSLKHLHLTLPDKKDDE